MGYEKKGEEDKVYKIRKTLYSLKQAPMTWYSKIEAYFVQTSFERCLCEHTRFTKWKEEGKFLIVSLYVDGLIYTRIDKSMCDDLNSMMLEFDMSDLGKIKYFLEVEVIQNSNEIFVCQRNYAREILARFGMDKSNSMHNPLVPFTKLTKNRVGTKVDKTLFK